MFRENVVIKIAEYMTQYCSALVLGRISNLNPKGFLPPLKLEYDDKKIIVTPSYSTDFNNPDINEFESIIAAENFLPFAKEIVNREREDMLMVTGSSENVVGISFHITN
jgi:hypothetical protein